MPRTLPRTSGTARKVAGTLRVPSAEAEERVADGTRSVPATLARPANGYAPHNRIRLAWLAALTVAAAAFAATGLAGQEPGAKAGHGTGKEAARPPEKPAAEADERAEAILRDRLAELKHRREQLREVLIRWRKETLKACGLSPENVVPVMLGLEREQFSLATEYEPKRARRDLLEKMIAETLAAAKAEGQSDVVVEYLKKIVAARELACKQLMSLHATGAVPADEVRKAEVDLVESQVRLALRKEELAKSKADAGIERLNQQLRELSLDLKQDEVRLNQVKARCALLSGARQIVDEYNQFADIELPAVSRQIEQVESRLWQLRAPLPHERP